MKEPTQLYSRVIKDVPFSNKYPKQNDNIYEDASNDYYEEE